MTATRKIPHGTRDGYNLHGCRCQKCWAMMPHGTVNCYATHRCRCAKCKAAKAAYVRERGYNRRVGRVAERKRQTDLNLRHPCENGCGRLCERQARVCRPCYEAELLASRRKVERLWAAGVSAREIGRQMGWSTPNPAVHIAVLRARGYDLPLRYGRGKTLA